MSDSYCCFTVLPCVCTAHHKQTQIVLIRLIRTHLAGDLALIVEEELYQEISPEVCLWPTPDWLWDNVQDGVAGAGSYKTPIVRGWMVTLGVKKNLCVKDGDQILR